TAAEFILLVIIFYCLLVEIGKRKKINKHFSMVTEHYCAIVENPDLNKGIQSTGSMLKAIERYETLLKATSDTIWDWDVVGGRMKYTGNVTKMLGYQNVEILNVVDWWRESIHPDDFDTVFSTLSEVFKNKLETIQMEYRFRCADGVYKDVYDRGFVTYDKNQKVTRLVGVMQDITYRKNEENGIRKAIHTAREQERSNIGLELHDNVNQILASTLLTLGMAKNKLIDREKMVELIDISKDYITNAIDELRRLSHELVPATFNDNNLKNVFESLLTDINLNNEFAINFYFDEAVHDMVPDDIQINLYRILQEQVKNIVTYSCATKIEIGVTLKENVVKMRTFDNGKGFDTRRIKRGIGLSNMKKRVDTFSGKLHLNSSPGTGCEIIVEIPAES
ncbi:MAG: PAS domain-containing protein, partial [Ginsengibacter sp.]